MTAYSLSFPQGFGGESRILNLFHFGAFSLTAC